MGQWIRSEGENGMLEASLLHDKFQRVYRQIQSRLPQMGDRVHPHYTLSSFVDALDPNDSLVVKLFEFLLRVQNNALTICW